MAPLPPIDPGANEAAWQIRRKELLDLVVDVEFGGMPPKPETLRVEQLQDILKSLGFWFGPKLKAYIGRDWELPFDQHFLKAAVAPRKLIETSARDDTWSNPMGSYLTHQAAKEVYSLLGVPDNIAYRIREGGHAHTPADFRALFDFMEDVHTVTDGFDVRP